MAMTQGARGVNLSRESRGPFPGEQASSPAPLSAPVSFPRGRRGRLLSRRIPGKKCQPAYKPGSVGPALRRTWRPFIWGRRHRRPQCNQPGQQRENTLRRARRPPRPSLFGLAPGGACRAATVASRAVRSYRTLSPLPRRTGAVCFLWRYPWGRPRRSLSGTLISWSPDFPPSRELAPRNSGRPADWRAPCGRWRRRRQQRKRRARLRRRPRGSQCCLSARRAPDCA